MPDEQVDSNPSRRIRNGRTTKLTALKNGPERAFAERAKRNGWAITKVGWPDFLCVNRHGDLFVVEVKAENDHRLRASQQLAMHLLARHGIPCWKWSPDGGFERIKNPPLPPGYERFKQRSGA